MKKLGNSTNCNFFLNQNLHQGRSEGCQSLKVVLMLTRVVVIIISFPANPHPALAAQVDRHGNPRWRRSRLDPQHSKSQLTPSAITYPPGSRRLISITFCCRKLHLQRADMRRRAHSSGSGSAINETSNKKEARRRTRRTIEFRDNKKTTATKELFWAGRRLFGEW